jgi:hypothetical protein
MMVFEAEGWVPIVGAKLAPFTFFRFGSDQDELA